MSDKFGFHNENSGLWFYPFPNKDKDGKEIECEPIWLCAPLLVIALAIDENERWGKLLEWVDPDGKIIRWMMPDRMIAEKDKPWIALRDRGLHMTTDAGGLGLLRKYLNTADTDKRVHVVERLGWFEKDDQLSYVLPDRVIGDVANIYYNGDQLSYTLRGSVEDWQQQIGRYCCGNSRLLFAVCVAFAPPLLKIMGEPSGGFNFWGLSQSGKTTITEAANTVVGWKKRTWRTTDNGLEGTAEQHCDSLLYLDEMGMVDPHVAGKIAYMYGNGEGKGRATITGEARPTKHWRGLFLSSGEITLADKMTEAGEKRRGGQEVRVIDIPSDAGAGMGLFENIHGAVDAREFAKQLQAATLNVSGAASIKYIEELIAADHSALSKMLRQQYDHFIKDTAPNLSGQARSVCGRFALVAVAGEFATRFGITGWADGEATQAAKTCFKAWLNERGHVGDSDIEQGIQQVIAYIEKYGDSRFQHLRPGEGDFVQSYNTVRMGYRRFDGQTTSSLSAEREPEHQPSNPRSVVEAMTAPIAEVAPPAWYYFVLPEAWKEITKGYNPTAIAKAMINRGLMIKKEKAQLTSKIRTPEGQVRVYHLSPNILE